MATAGKINPVFATHRSSRLLFIGLAVLLTGALAYFLHTPWNALAAALVAGLVLWLGNARWDGAGASGDKVDYVGLLGQIGEGNLKVSPDSLAGQSEAARNAAAMMIFGLRRMVASIRGLGSSLDQTTLRLSDSSTRQLKDAKSQNDAVVAATTALADVESSVGMVKDGIKELMLSGDKNAAAVVEMQSSIEEVSAGITELVEAVTKTTELSKVATTSSAQVAKSAEQLTASATQNSAAMLEMDATIQQVNQFAKESEQIAGSAVKGARTGRAAVQATVDSLQSIETAVAAGNAAVGALGQRGQQIGSIVSVIKEIADQTGLLALNASILAAQAGEHGRGFSVVAEEIRELSERTTGSTREIADLIHAIREAVEEAQGRMEVGAERAREGVGVGRNALVAFDEVGAVIEKTRGSAMSIARAMDEQSRGSHEVTQAMENMSQQITQISEEAQQQAQVARELTSEAEQMHDRAMLFKQAMESQAAGTATINQVTEKLSFSIEVIRAAIDSIASSSSDLGDISDRLKQSAATTTNSAVQLASTVSGLSHEASFLRDEVSRFHLPQPQPTVALQLAIRDSNPSLDFTNAATVRAAELSSLVGEGLLVFGNGTVLQPRLAERWYCSGDGLTYTFHLKAGVRFSDGTPLTAADFIASFERVADPRTKNGNVFVLEPVAGYEEFKSGAAKNISGLRAEGDLVLHITLKEPLVFFPALTTLCSMFAMPAAYARQHHNDLAIEPLGTGPYRVEEFEARRIVFTRNPHYHRPGMPRADRLNVRLDLDPEHQINAFINGELDVLDDVHRSRRKELMANPALRPLMESITLMATTFLTLRCDIPPFNDKRVRLAVNHAIDRRRLVSEIHGGIVEMATGFLPRGLPGHDPERRGFVHDPALSRRLLAEAGFPGGLQVDTFGMASQNWTRDPERRMMNEMLDAVGIRIRFEEVSDEEYRRRTKEKGRPAIVWSGWYADYPDPDNFFYVVLHSSQSVHVGTNYSNPALDTLIMQGRRESDAEQRDKIYRRAEQLLLEDPPLAFLYHDRGFVMHQADIGGMLPHLTTPILHYEDIWRIKPGE